MTHAAGHTTAAADPALLDPTDAALLVDQYELTMLREDRDSGMDEPAVFSLFVRRLPEDRNHLLA